MVVGDNKWLGPSSSAHSIGVQGAVTTPSYPNKWVANQAAWNKAGLQGSAHFGLSGLNFDGSGLFGSGLFSGDPSTWGVSEIFAGLIGVYAAYAMIHQGKQTKYRFEATANRRRKTRAKKLREKAKKLDEGGGMLSAFI